MTAARERRTQLLGRGERAVLLTRRRAEESEAQATVRALDWVAKCGFDLVAILDPDDYREAFGMIVSGLVDVIVVSRPEHLPSVRMMWAPEPRQPMLVERGSAAARVEPGGGVRPLNRQRPQMIRQPDPERPEAEPPNRRRTQPIRRREAS